MNGEKGRWVRGRGVSRGVNRTNAGGQGESREKPPQTERVIYIHIYKAESSKHFL